MKSKETLSLTFDYSARIIALILPYELLNFARLFWQRIQWHSMRKKLGAVGENSYIEFPMMIRNPKNIFIGKKFSALNKFRIETFENYMDQTFNPKIIIGDNVAFNNDCHIGCINKIEIGNNVLFGSRIYITDHCHGNVSEEDIGTVPVKRKLSSKGPVIIRDNVWVGEGVTILPGVTIGENSIIGANSLVNRNIPSNTVAAGIPAKAIKYLSK